MTDVIREFADFLDPERMKKLFEQELPVDMTKDWRLLDCRIQHPRFKTYLNPASQEKSFLALVYHLEGVNRTTQCLESQIVYAKAYLAARSRQVYEQTCREYRQAQRDRIFHWPEHDLVGWLFPFDPVLTWLPDLLSPDNILPYFSHLLLAQNESTPGIVNRVETEIINYRPEIRCTCRHDIQRLSKRVHSLFSKTYADHHGREVFRRLIALHRHSGNQPDRFAVPAPLGYEEVHRTVWMESLQGEALSKRINADTAVAAMTQLAQSLADFHRHEMSGLPVLGTADQLGEIGKKITKLNKAFPQWQARMQALLDKLTIGHGLQAGIPVGLIHGDFHLDQLLWLKNGRIGLFDYDELAQGNPLVDVANFCADLYNHDMDKALVSTLILVFFAAYRKFSHLDLNVEQFNWHLRIQLLTRAYRAFIQQKTEQEKLIAHFLNLAEQGVNLT